MDAELVERVLECLRGCDIGESISADGIADEIGGKLSDVYDALEDLENAKLVEMHPACRKGSDPTYTLTPKGKRHMQPEVQERPEPEPAKEENDAPELRPSADRMCRFCGKVMEPNKVRRHENLCGKNPDSVSNAARRKTTKDEAIVTNATAVLEHEVEAEPEIPEVLEQLNAEDPDVPDEVPVFDEKAERIVGRIEDAIGKAAQVNQLVLESTPGMDRLLMLLNQCQGALRSGVIMTLEAEITIEPGLSVIIRVDGGVPNAE